MKIIKFLFYVILLIVSLISYIISIFIVSINHINRTPATLPQLLSEAFVQELIFSKISLAIWIFLFIKYLKKKVEEDPVI